MLDGVTVTSNGGTRSCPVCGATPTRALHVRTHRRILRCRCGLVLIDPLPPADTIAEREGEAFRGELMDETREMFAAYGRDYRPDDPVVRAFQHHLATLGRLTRGRRLLDVGIGTGLLVHLARAAGWDASGVEICDEAAERARREFDIAVTTGDFAAVDVAGGLDVITMADVLEHTYDPRAFLAAARERLKPGGVLYVAVPNHRSLVFLTADLLGKLPGGGGIADRLYVPNHYTYFTPDTLTRLARDVGFEVAAVERENPYLGRYQMHPVIRAGLATLLAVSTATGLQSRVVMFARRPA